MVGVGNVALAAGGMEVLPAPTRMEPKLDGEKSEWMALGQGGCEQGTPITLPVELPQRQ